MTLPWYGDLPTSTPGAGARPTAHAGLRFDRFCDGWEERQGLVLEGDQKKRFFERVLRDYEDGRDVVGRMLEQALEAHRRLVKALWGHDLAKRPGGPGRQYRTSGRVVTGLGIGHVLDTGFVWHPTLGVPFFPGSSIKGAIRAWADPGKGWADAADWEAVRRLFGDEGGVPPSQGQPGAAEGVRTLERGSEATSARRAMGESGQQGRAHGAIGAGSLVVFDALPVRPPEVDIDVMNIHYAPYYRDGRPPADSTDPTLVYFLAIRPGQEFEFWLAPRPGARYPIGRTPQQDLQEGLALLEKALRLLGLGAKTAAGYGRFEPVSHDSSAGMTGSGASQISGPEVSSRRQGSPSPGRGGRGPQAPRR